MIEAIKPTFGNDGTFWMSFKDFCTHFELLNICKITEYQEKRFKCEFEIKMNQFDGLPEALSNWVYKIEAPEATTLSVGIHQLDQRFPGISENFPYFPAAIALMKLDENGQISFCSIDEFDRSRDLQAEFRVEAGTHLVVPMTSGCTLIRPDFKSNEESYMITDKEGNLSPQARLVLTQIFFRLDTYEFDGKLSREELQAFVDKFENRVSPTFRAQIKKAIEKVTSLTLDQFLNFVVQKIINQQVGKLDPIVIFEEWGYDPLSLWPTSVQCSAISLLSELPIDIQPISVKEPSKKGPQMLEIMQTIYNSLLQPYPKHTQLRLMDT